MESRARILKIIAGLVVAGLVWFLFGKYIMLAVDVGVSLIGSKGEPTQ